MSELDAYKIIGIHPIGCKCFFCCKREGLVDEVLRKAIANDPPCFICGKPKGQPPDRCPGHYEMPRDTAPQPPPVQLSHQQVIGALERGQLALLDRIAALEAIIEADRTRIIDGVNALEKVANGKFWLTEGRGSCEWNDDRYRKEFGEAVRSILKAVEPLRKIGADLTNCPQTTAEVVKARADKDVKIAAIEAELAEAQALIIRLADKPKECVNPLFPGDPSTCQFDPCRCENPCPLCGSDERDHRGILICECPHADAIAPAVAEFVAGVERRGAGKELRRIISEYRASISCDGAVGIDDLEARAAELEGK